MPDSTLNDPPHVTRRALRRRLVHRLVRNAALVSALVLLAVMFGATGYHVLDGLPWLDAMLNAAMILTGMGPVNPITTPAAKIFATFYALFSGVFFLTMVAVLLAPALHHFMHRFHLELRSEGTPDIRDQGLAVPSEKSSDICRQ